MRRQTVLNAHASTNLIEGMLATLLLFPVAETVVKMRAVVGENRTDFDRQGRMDCKLMPALIPSRI